MDYKHLYFETPPANEPEFDISDVLTTVGVTVKINNTQIKWAYELGALGGDPEGIDCTPLASEVHLEKAGVEQMEKWTINYYYNDDDADNLDDMIEADTSYAIEVKTSNGTKWTNNGKVASNYADGISVNGMLQMKATVELSGKWTRTTAGS